MTGLRPQLRYFACTLTLLAAASAAPAQEAQLRLQPLAPGAGGQFVSMSRDGSTIMARANVNSGVEGPVALPLVWIPATNTYRVGTSEIISPVQSRDGSLVLLPPSVIRPLPFAAEVLYSSPPQNDLFIDDMRPLGLAADTSSFVFNPSRAVRVPSGGNLAFVSAPIVLQYSRTTGRYTEYAWSDPFAVPPPGTVQSVVGIGASDDLLSVLVRMSYLTPCFVCETARPGFAPLDSTPVGNIMYGVVSPRQSPRIVMEGVPTSINGDGTIVAGYSSRIGVPGRSAPALWRTPFIPGNVPLLTARPIRIALPAAAFGGGFLAISANGEVAVGGFTAPAPRPIRPLIWIKARGSRDLTEVLAKFNVSPPPSVVLGGARAISDDGRIISGLAFGPLNTVSLYQVTLPAGEVCYANCDGSTGPNPLSAADVECFTRRLAQRQFYADCNNDGRYDATDMTCFMARYTAGCGS